MNYLLTKIGAGFLGLLSIFSGGTEVVYTPVEVPEQETPVLGATFDNPTVVALFETTLASRISSSDTTMTLTSAADKEGNTLASSTYGFIIDEGTASEEFVLADCTGTTCINMTRGVSVVSGTTSVSSLQKEHRRGASVKITDGPVLLSLSRLSRGIQEYATPIKYATTATSTFFTSAKDLVSKSYVDGVAFSGAGVVDASETAKGVVEIATGVEAASSTSNGGSGRLVIPASLATSTYNLATAALRVLMTNERGTIDPGFVASSTNFSSAGYLTAAGAVTFPATSTVTIGAFPAWSIGKQRQVITTLGTSTFSVPSGVTHIEVEVQGGGGGGGGSTTDGTGGGGGGGGGYAWEIIDVSGTTSIQVFVGAGGAAGLGTGGDGGTASSTHFGTNGFYLTAAGGTGGQGSSSNSDGGTGGCGSGGDLNTCGSGGGGGATTVGENMAGAGGASRLGGGGLGRGANNNSTTGENGKNYGGGGGGAQSTAGDVAGGAGAQGVIIIRW